MNLQEALDLMAEMIADTQLVLEGVAKKAGKSVWVDEGTEFPDDFKVTTTDGEVFSVIYFTGAYSDYGYDSVDSRKEWRDNSRRRRREYVLTDGPWHKRTIVEITPEVFTGFTRVILRLSCGHDEYSYEHQPGVIGDVVTCDFCLRDKDLPEEEALT